MILAQISDTHIKADGKLAYGVVDTEAHLRTCVAQLLGLRPAVQAVLITGDLVDHGRDDEYAVLRDALSPLTCPIYVMPGNHDDRQALRRAFAGPGFEYLEQSTPWIQYAMDLGPCRLLALDTLIPMQSGGVLCADRLAWLDAELSASTKPCIVAMHHPPFATGIAHMDRIGLENWAGFEAIIAKHKHVERIVCGHLHRNIQCRIAHTVAVTCPSPAHQVALDLSADGPDHFMMEPPGYLLHAWVGGRLVTHQAVIGQFAGPHPFRENGVLIDA